MKPFLLIALFIQGAICQQLIPRLYFPSTEQSAFRCKPEPFSIENATIVAQGQIAPPLGAFWKKFECLYGYQLNKNGQPYITCDPLLNQWVIQGSCQRIPLKACDYEPELENAVIFVGSSAVDAYRSFTCITGFEVTGTAKIYCNADGIWVSLGSCRRINNQPLLCPADIYVRNAIVQPHTVDSGRIGTQLYFTCQTGFYLNGGNGLLTCQRNGQWKVSGACGRPCGDLPELPNGSFGYGGYDIGATRAITCNRGYQLNAPANYIRCDESGDWTAINGRCEPLGTRIIDTQPGYLVAITSRPLYLGAQGTTRRPTGISRDGLNIWVD